MEKKSHNDATEEKVSLSVSSVESNSQNQKQEGVKNNRSEIVIFLRDICIILGVVLLLRTYIASPFRINGSSMESSYHNNELIIVDKVSYNLGLWGISKATPKRGDVVVIQPHSIHGKDFFIKRIVGIPGDSIKISDGYIFVKPSGYKEFIQLSEGYLNEENFGKTYPGRSSMKAEFIVPLNEYFILGDNRNGSSDSRDCFYTCSVEGSSYYIKRKDIVGKLWVTLGALKILEPKSIIDNLEEGDGMDNSKIFSISPRFLKTPSTWSYPEIQ